MSQENYLEEALIYLQEKPIIYSGTKIVALAKAHGNTIEKKQKMGCEKWSVKAPFKGQKYRDKMVACKAKAAIQGLQASGKYAQALGRKCADARCKKAVANFLIDVKDEIKDNKYYLK